MNDVKETGPFSEENLAGFRARVDRATETAGDGLNPKVVTRLGEAIIATEQGEEEPDALHTAIAMRNVVIYVAGQKDERLNEAIGLVNLAAKDHFPSYNPEEMLELDLQ